MKLPKYLYTTCLIAFSLAFTVRSHGQGPLPSVSPVKTPEVNAFNRRVETPVSYYTGVPNISIPLYQVSINGVSVPITLSYHAGGIRADQEATWVGLGWNLDYGGSISRKVRGAPDEDYFIKAGTVYGGSVDYFNSLPVATNNDHNIRMDYVRVAKYQGADFLPDEFYYSVLGQSGRFMFSQRQNKFILFPKEDIAITQYNSPPNQYGTITPLYYWTLKTADGTAVDFGKDATTATRDNIKTVKNSWQILKIKNRFNDSISFSYDTLSYRTYPMSGVKASFYHLLAAGGSGMSIPPNEIPSAMAFSAINNFDSRVKSISFPDGSVDFFTISRVDMPTKALSEIQVKDKNGNLIRKIKFIYDYFYGSAFDMLPSQNSALANSYEPSNYRFTRLKLNALEVTGSDGKIQRYSFTYKEDINLPSKYTFAQDHWGFYNGIANTTAASFIPNVAPGYFTGGDRSVKPQNSSAFSLTSITYPEGGKTSFEYESNTAQLASIPNELLQMYQDDNIPEVSQGINLSSYSRRSYQTTIDSTSGSSVFFLKKFTVGNNGLMATNLGFTCSTNYGISTLEQYTPYNADNVEFFLNKIEANGTKTLVRNFNTTAQNPDANGVYQRVGTFNTGLSLTAGKYEMGVRLTYLNGIGSAAEAQPYNLYFNVKYRAFDTTKMMINVGGLRIKKIKYSDSDGTLKKVKSYTYTNPTPSIPTLTSGRIVSLPNYFQRTSQEYWNSNVMWGTIAAINFSANSITPLETTSGSYAGYEYVDEFDTDTINNNNFRTNYRFSFNQPYLYSSTYPLMSLRAYEPNEWENGKLLAKKVFKASSVIYKEDYTYYSISPHLSSGNQEEFVQEINTDLISLQYLATAISSNYDFGPYDGGPSITTIYNGNSFGHTDNCVTYYYGARTGNYNPVVTGYGALLCPGVYLNVPYFQRFTAITKPKSKVVTTYNNGHPIVQTEKYYYQKTPALYQLTATKIATSTKDTIETRISYPIDSSSVSIYAKMLSRHIVNAPILQAEYFNGAFMQSKYTKYKQWPDTVIIAPVQEFGKVRSGPQYLKLNYLGYDSKGNVLSAQRPGGGKVSVIWNSTKSYVLANVSNAAANDVFLETFEEGTGNSTDAKTGMYSHTGAYAKTISGLDNGNYTLSYWRKDVATNTWALIRSAVTVTAGSTTFSTSLQIDDLSLIPIDAQITYYTYEPLVGVTSITDPKRQISYYEYDGLQRLVNMRDKDRNIIKNFTYNYGNQPSGASIPTLSLDNTYYTAVTIRCMTTADPSSGCYLKYTDLSNNQVYQTAITCNATTSPTVGVPAQGRSYKFEVYQNLTAGGQLVSSPLTIYVP